MSGVSSRIDTVLLNHGVKNPEVRSAIANDLQGIESEKKVVYQRSYDLNPGLLVVAGAIGFVAGAVWVSKSTAGTVIEKFSQFGVLSDEKKQAIADGLDRAIQNLPSSQRSIQVDSTLIAQDVRQGRIPREEIEALLNPAYRVWALRLTKQPYSQEAVNQFFDEAVPLLNDLLQYSPQ